MDRFSARQNKIISLISQSDKAISGKELSLKTALSLRTVQSEISQINKILPLVLSTNKGYRIDRDVFSTLTAAKTDESTDGKKILYSLFFSDSPYYYEDLAEDLYLSSSTLDNRIKELNGELSSYGLCIRKSNGFLSIEGEERNKREYIRKLMEDELSSSYLDLTYLENYFEDTDIEHIRLIFINSIDSHNCYIDQIYLDNVLVSIIIALYRMRDDHYITQSIVNIPETAVEYQISKDICSQYSDHWHIEPTNEDVQYVASLLIGQVRSLALADGINKPEEVMKESFVNEIDSILSDTFSKFLLDIDYSAQLSNFCLHIDAMLKRAKINRPAENLLLENLKKNSPFIYDVSVYITQRIAERFDVRISESEIGFISVHIGYLIESSLQNNKKINLILYCDDYHNIADKIQNSLRANLADFAHIDVVRYIDLEDPRIKAADIIITTKSLDIFGKKIVRISPFYTLQDQMKVLPTVQSSIEEKEDRRMMDLFHRFFSQDLFFKSNELTNRDEIIDFMSQKLVDKNIVDEGFKASCMKRESLSPTCFFGSFAIPHAMELNARQTMCCVYINDKGIRWGQEEVYLVIMIAGLKSDLADFMELYNGFIQLMDPVSVAEIVKAKDFSDFARTLSSLKAK